MVKGQNPDVGVELLFLLRQQRCLCHQLKMLTDRHRQLAGVNSPELMLGVVLGRRKLAEKLQGLNDKLRPIKANWQKLSGQIGPEYRLQAYKMASEVKGIIEDILAVTPSETAQNLPLNEGCGFDELFVNPQLQQ